MTQPHAHAFADVRAVVVGDVILDRYWYGSTARISPEAPVPVVCVDETEERPGGAANVAVNVAGLGAAVTLIGVVGEDAEAGRLTGLLARFGIDCSFQVTPGRRTVAKLRVLSRHQQLIRLDFENSGPAPDTGDLLERFRTSIAGADVAIVSDYAKGSVERVAELIGIARAAGKRVVVDPKGPDFTRYRGASIVTPNRREFEAVAGSSRDLREFERKAERLRAGLDLEVLLVTRGEEGMSVFAAGGEPFHLAAHAREVFDVTGAGDTVCAVFATALAAGEDLRHAAALANAAAGIVVGRLGATGVSTAEIEVVMRGTPAARSGVLSEEKLAEEVAAARRRGEKIVMTNGCFDLLHSGHIDCLAQARALGDRLIVAVNDDVSVRRLKGPGRPLVPHADRMQVLAALAAVDWVVGFADVTPERLIERILPDVLVKGGDYAEEQIAGAAAVRARGGEVVVLPYREGRSTSALIDAVRGAGSG
jgi:D-beta-D-heptose 7-phosphate kinase/D-beta-D-heptose 1-phosphate adenosyltransferase